MSKTQEPVSGSTTSTTTKTEATEVKEGQKTEFACGECDKKFKSQPELTMHANDVHGSRV